MLYMMYSLFTSTIGFSFDWVHMYQVAETIDLLMSAQCSSPCENFVPGLFFHQQCRLAILNFGCVWCEAEVFCVVRLGKSTE